MLTISLVSNVATRILETQVPWASKAGVENYSCETQVSKTRVATVN